MNEEFLYYIWQFRLFNNKSLLTTDNEPLTIIHPGHRNYHAGPDFSEAKIKIGSTIWAGNVEIHTKSSDWVRHNHQKDKAYSNIILHVVYEDDAQVNLSESQAKLSTLELRDCIKPNLFRTYSALIDNANWIPCEKQIQQVDDFKFKTSLHRLLVERLEKKTGEIASVLSQNKNNWEETFYQITAKNFGLKINVTPFELLAKSLPLKVIAKHKNNLSQIEALIFGQAGFLLSSFKDAYPNQLKKEYAFLQKKYGLEPIGVHLWKFLRLRPASFPTIRLAQFSRLLFQSTHLFSKILSANQVAELVSLFRVETSAYWKDHYRFDMLSENRQKRFGMNAINILIINSIIPTLFHYGTNKNDHSFKDKAFRFLEQLPAEKNAIITTWGEVRYRAQNAFESQALIELKNTYCEHKKCLNCAIGHEIIKK